MGRGIWIVVGFGKRVGVRWLWRVGVLMTRNYEGQHPLYLGISCPFRPTAYRVLLESAIHHFYLLPSSTSLSFQSLASFIVTHHQQFIIAFRLFDLLAFAYFPCFKEWERNWAPGKWTEWSGSPEMLTENSISRKREWWNPIRRVGDPKGSASVLCIYDRSNHMILIVKRDTLLSGNSVHFTVPFFVECFYSFHTFVFFLVKWNLALGTDTKHPSWCYGKCHSVKFSFKLSLWCFGVTFY